MKEEKGRRMIYWQGKEVVGWKEGRRRGRMKRKKEKDKIDILLMKKMMGVKSKIGEYT